MKEVRILDMYGNLIASVTKKDIISCNNVKIETRGKVVKLHIKGYESKYQGIKG